MPLLERGLTFSPANFHLKIMLVRVYLEAGLVGAADQAYTLLEAKQIQLDSLGYLHTPLLAPLGHLSRASTLLDRAAKFFVANYKQVIFVKAFYLIEVTDITGRVEFPRARINSHSPTSTAVS